MEHGSRASIARTRRNPVDACIGDGHRCSLVFTFSCVLSWDSERSRSGRTRRRATMTFQTLYGGELFCMPDAFGDRHALRAWGTCNTNTEQYSIGQPKTVPQVATLTACARTQTVNVHVHALGPGAIRHCRPSSFRSCLFRTLHAACGHRQRPDACTTNM
jgi:hypothetical protein